MRCLTGFLFASMSLLAVAGDADTRVEHITWIERPESEQSIRINASTFSVLKQYLNFDITEIEATTARALRMLNSANEVMCRGDLIKTESRAAEFAVASLPQVVYPSVRLFSHHKLASPVSLNALKQLPYVLPMQMHRDYGFDPTVLTGGELIVMSMMTKSGPDNAIKLFDHKRADLLIEYPSVYQTYSEAPERKDIFVYPIEGQDEYALGYVMCSNTPQGKWVVSEFDRAIDTASKTPDYLSAHQQWFSQFDVSPLYHSVYQEARGK